MLLLRHREPPLDGVAIQGGVPAPRDRGVFTDR
jgi:hypothetical protein